jgi:hypothetical protein
VKSGQAELGCIARSVFPLELDCKNGEPSDTPLSSGRISGYLETRGYSVRYFTNALPGVDVFEDENSIPALSRCALGRVSFGVLSISLTGHELMLGKFGLIKPNLPGEKPIGLGRRRPEVRILSPRFPSPAD